jgi:hypothetical protein
LAKLLRADFPVGPFAACRSHVATLPGFPAIEKHVDNFVTTAPVATTRMVAALVASLRVHIPTIELKSKRPLLMPLSYLVPSPSIRPSGYSIFLRLQLCLSPRRKDRDFLKRLFCSGSSVLVLEPPSRFLFCYL